MIELPNTLRKFRIAQILITSMLSWGFVKLLLWMTETPFNELGNAQVGVIAVVAPAIVAGLLGIVDKLIKRFEKDHHDEK